MKHLLTVLGCLALLAPAPLAHAQGVQTGTITGSVKSADGLSLPGVTVTAASPALQGQRSTVTDVNGVYFIKGLPAGTYTVGFEISAFKPATARRCAAQSRFDGRRERDDDAPPAWRRPST